MLRVFRYYISREIKQTNCILYCTVLHQDLHPFPCFMIYSHRICSLQKFGTFLLLLYKWLALRMALAVVGQERIHMLWSRNRFALQLPSPTRSLVFAHSTSPFPFTASPCPPYPSAPSLRHSRQAPSLFGMRRRLDGAFLLHFCHRSLGHPYFQGIGQRTCLLCVVRCRPH